MQKKYLLRFNLLLSLIISLLLTSCASQKPILSKEVSRKVMPSENTTVTYTLSPKAKLETYKDTQKATYIKIVKGNNIVIKIEGVKKSLKNMADSGYREVLYFEIPNKNKDLKMGDLKNSAVKLWFARFCFCRDYIGFYKITDGKLNIKLSKKALKIKATIRFNNLPQVLNFIDQNLPIKQ